ncbi:MAG: membrane protein insertase YidC [Planctomycetota bacterium]
MARKPNTLLRTLVPLIAILAGLGVVAAVFISTQPSRQQPAPQQAQQPTEALDEPQDSETLDAGGVAASAGDAPEPDADEQPTETLVDQVTEELGDAAKDAAETVADARAKLPGNEAAGDPAPEQPSVESDTDVAIDGLRAEVFGDVPVPAPLGGLERNGEWKLRLEFSNYGAGIASMRLADVFVDVVALTKDRSEPGSVDAEGHTQIQSERISGNAIVSPFMAVGVDIDGSFVLLTRDADGAVWRPIEGTPGGFEAFVLNGDGERVARLTRVYRLRPGSYDLALDQRIENLTGAPFRVKWYQFGPIDMPEEAIGYGGDKRRVRFGYLNSPTVDPARAFVAGEDYLWPRNRALGDRQKPANVYQETDTLWPNRKSEKERQELVWAGMTNRYFGVAVHRQLGDAELSSGTFDRTLNTVETIDRVVLEPATGEGMVLRLNSPELTVAPGGAGNASIAVYAGPLSRPEIRAHPRAAALGVDELVVYNFGGPCAFCTFTFLTDLLLWVLLSLQSLVSDWALAIILLVVCVRGVLHPVTRWSQIRVQRFGKQMQSLGPKQQKLRDKFKDDPKRMQAETAKLWKEEGISPAGMLGCLPMFLQSPIWIALYAVLYFSIELRHNPAFFGLFQTIGNWQFMADLASPDHAIEFARGFNVPLISGLMGPIHGINVLPLLLGVVFYVQQKYLTPPPSASLSPEQEQQQKIIRVMTVVMFPLFMYNAPAGLSLYFITNSTLGILEARWIRSHAEKHGLLDVDKMREQAKARRAGKPAKTGGFLERLQQAAEEQQRLREQREKGQAAPGTGKRSQYRAGKGEKPDPGRRFKKKK